MPASVLVIESVDMLADAIESGLVKYLASWPPITIHLATCLTDALELMTREYVDSVLLDLNLPDASQTAAYEVLHCKYPDLPLVVLSDGDVECDGAFAVILKKDLDMRHVLARIIMATTIHKLDRMWKPGEDALLRLDGLHSRMDSEIRTVKGEIHPTTRDKP